MSANFTPELNSYTDLTPFRYWCQKVLPLVYDDSLSYYELLCKVIDYLNKTMEDVNLAVEDVGKLRDAYDSLQTYVNTYFDNLDVQEEINNKLDEMVEDGTIRNIFSEDVQDILNVASDAAQQAIADIPENVTDWLEEHITQETGYVIDDTLTVQGAAADAKKSGDEISALKSDLNNVNNALFDEDISVNRFNSGLVTTETITSDKRLYGNGSLVDTTGIDVTPFLPIEPETEYWFGLVPVYGSAGIPSYGTSIVIEFYSEETNTAFISRIDRLDNNAISFITPANAKYYRFNIARSSGITLNLLAQRCMLVYGNIAPTEFIAYHEDRRTSNIETLDNKINTMAPIQYALQNNILTVKSKYGNGEITIEFGKRGPNNLPDFRLIVADDRQKYNNETDWFGPFLMSAVNNGDGDDPTGRTYTGGNHNYLNTGALDGGATARCVSLVYRIDKKTITEGTGYANTIEIVWKNRVQAYNTKKADGTGREVLEERHKMIFDGIQWEVYTEIEPLEDIFCDAYYGMQCYVKEYGTIYMIGADYRLPFLYTSPHDSGNNVPNIYVAHDTADRLEMEVDRSLDLGRGTMYGTSGTQGFRTASTKGYTYFISQKNMSANTIYGARGWYRFMPSL